MIRRILSVALILALFVSEEAAGTEATALTTGAGEAVENALALDECQDCAADYYYDSFEGTWVAWIAYSQHGDGQCLYSLPDCRRCNGNPGCEGFFDSHNFESGPEADQWLESNADCGNCNEGGGGSLTAAVETRDAGRLATLIAASDGAVWLNRDRRAVQGRGCAVDGVGLHVRLDVSVFAAVVAELEQIQSNHITRQAR